MEKLDDIVLGKEEQKYNYTQDDPINEDEQLREIDEIDEYEDMLRRKRKKKKKKKKEEPKKSESLWDVAKSTLKNAAVLGISGLGLYTALNFSSIAGSVASSLRGIDKVYDPSRPETDNYLGYKADDIKSKISDEEYRKRKALENARRERQDVLTREKEVILRNQKITGDDIDEAFERNYDNRKNDRYLEDDNNIIESGNVSRFLSKAGSLIFSRLRDTTKITIEYARLGASFLFKSFRINTDDFKDYFEYGRNGLIISLPYDSYDEICYSIAYLYSYFKSKTSETIKQLTNIPPTKSQIVEWGRSNSGLISRYVKSALDSIDFYDWAKKVVFFSHRSIFKNQLDAPSYDEIDYYFSPVKLINNK